MQALNMVQALNPTAEFWVGETGIILQMSQIVNGKVGHLVEGHFKLLCLVFPMLFASGMKERVQYLNGVLMFSFSKLLMRPGNLQPVEKTLRHIGEFGVIRGSPNSI
jgi:hypothetical protein